MKISIVTIGEPKNSFSNIFDEYVKRISAFSKVEVFHIKENKDAGKKAARIMDKTFKIVLSEEGKKFSSKSFAKMLEKKEISGQSEISFFIGGPDGHSQEVKDGADIIMSFSDLTMPHDFAMIFLAETIYRSLSIMHNHPYHRQ